MIPIGLKSIIRNLKYSIDADNSDGCRTFALLNPRQAKLLLKIISKTLPNNKKTN